MDTPDPTIDPTGGDLPPTEFTDEFPDPPQDPVDLGTASTEGGAA